MNRLQRKLIEGAEELFLSCFSDFYKKFKFSFDTDETEDDDILKLIATIEMDNGYKSDIELYVQTDIQVSDVDEMRFYINVAVYDEKPLFSEEIIWQAVAINKCIA